MSRLGIGARHRDQHEPFRARLTHRVERDLDGAMVGPEQRLCVRLADATDQVDERVATRQHLGQLIRAMRVEDGDLCAETPEGLGGRGAPDRRPNLVASQQRPHDRVTQHARRTRHHHRHRAPG